jgi:hypothetical protein
MEGSWFDPQCAQPFCFFELLVSARESACCMPPFLELHGTVCGLSSDVFLNRAGGATCPFLVTEGTTLQAIQSVSGDCRPTA